MKHIITLGFLLIFSSYSYSQTTVTFKPNAAVGEDVFIYGLDNNCVPNEHPIYTGTPGNWNFGNLDAITLSRWTYNAEGCSQGTVRSLIRFTEISTLPVGVYIISAKLRLFTPSSSSIGAYNSYFPNSPFPTNEAWAIKVNSGAANNWDENIVTFNNSASMTYAPLASWVAMPATNLQFNYTVEIDLTSIVSEIYNDIQMSVPFANNGILLKLANESIYRSQMFASSDHTNSALWPELEITYSSEPVEECDASFTISTHSSNPNNYTFSAINQFASTYDWTVNGVPAGNAPMMNYTFAGSGNYSVCLTTLNTTIECSECFDMCIGKISDGGDGDDPNSINNMGNSINFLKVTPNPSKNGWSIMFNSSEMENLKIDLIDVTGRSISQQTYNTHKGENKVYLQGNKLTKGVYFVQLKSTKYTNTIKVVKE